MLAVYSWSGGRRRLRTVPGAVLLVAGALAFSSVTATAATAEVAGSIRPLHSALCLEINTDSTTRSTAQQETIVQSVCDGGLDQSFVLRNVGGGLVEISNTETGHCLAVADASALPGAAVVQHSCNRATNSLFFVEQIGGTMALKVQHTAMCLDVRAASTAPGADLLQWPCHGLDHQRFSWQPVGERLVVLPGESSVPVLPGVSVPEEPSVPVLPGVSGAEVSEIPVLPGVSGAEVSEIPVLPGAPAVGEESPASNVPVLPAPSVGTDRHATGVWDPVIDIGLVPVAMANLPSGDVLMWSAYEKMTFGGSNGYTQTVIFDPDTGDVRSRTVGETQHDMFCPGIANMPDGRVMITGGSNNTEASVYNPATDRWEDASDLNIGRGYHSNVALADGSVLAVGGSWSGGIAIKDSEIYRDGQWVRLPGIRGGGSMGTADKQGQYRADNHMWLFAWKDGKVFHAGPSRTMHWLDPAGQGSVIEAGRRGVDGDAMNGSAVMFDIGKILTAGGGPNYNSGSSTGNSHVIDLNAGGAARQVQSLSYPRAQQSTVVLPSGEVVVVGGRSLIGLFSDDHSVMVPELFDPDTETWSSLAPMSVPRNYHSAGLLLSDGRVLVGGGGLCGGCSGRPETNHPDVQILTPPYLLDSSGALKPRPVIDQAPQFAGYGQSISVSVSGGAAEFSLVRLSNSTHSTNNDQRRIPVSFASSGDGGYELTMPGDPGVAPPGSYMLFALNADGTPSVSSNIVLG